LLSHRTFEDKNNGVAILFADFSEYNRIYFFSINIQDLALLLVAADPALETLLL
jgi:hypothetical protein